MKAIAVPYIIAILLGVGVIGLVGYWLFVSGGQFGGGVATTTCRSAQLNYCNTWVAQGKSTADTAWNQANSGTGCTKPDSENKICESYGVKISSTGGSAIADLTACAGKTKPECTGNPPPAPQCVNGNWRC